MILLGACESFRKCMSLYHLQHFMRYVSLKFVMLSFVNLLLQAVNAFFFQYGRLLSSGLVLGG